MNDINTSIGTQLSILDADLLRRTAKWARFLAIVGFVMIGFMVLIGVFAGSFMGMILAKESALTGMPVNGLMGAFGAMYTVLFLLIALLYFFPTLYLYRFATRTLKTVNGPFDGAVFSGGIDSLRKLFAFMGVLTLIVLCVYGLFFLIAAIGAAAMS